MSGHTPGPWAVDAKYLSEVQTADDKTVASCWHKQADGQDIRVTGVLCCSLEESAANARLIAAAPDLLASLIELLEPLERASAAMVAEGKSLNEAGEAAFDRARAAIARATPYHLAVRGMVMADKAHECWTVSATSYLRNLDREDLSAECFAVHFQNAPVKTETGTSMGLIFPTLIVSSYFNEPREIADRVAAILNKYWDKDASA